MNDLDVEVVDENKSTNNNVVNQSESNNSDSLSVSETKTLSTNNIEELSKELDKIDTSNNQGVATTSNVLNAFQVSNNVAQPQSNVQPQPQATPNVLNAFQGDQTKQNTQTATPVAPKAQETSSPQVSAVQNPAPNNGDTQQKTNGGNK